MRTVRLYMAVCIITGCTSHLSAGPQYVIRYSHLAVADPNVQASSAHARTFKAELESRTAGRVRVDIFPAGQLGGQVSSVQQVRKGTIHVCDISSGVLASLYYEPLEILDIPYLFSSRDVARIVLDNDNPFTHRLIEDCAEKTGIRILALGIFGYRHMTNNVRQIRVPQDMAGLKMRTMEIAAHMKMMQSLGATAVPVPWLELYTSLQTRVVDGEETTLQNIVMGRLYQVQKHLTVTGHLLGVGAFLCNEKWYQSLPEDIRRAVIDTEKVARHTYDVVGERLDAEALVKLGQLGMEVYIPTPQEKSMFAQKARPYVRRWMQAKHGGRFVQEFFDTIERAERQLQQRRSESTNEASG